MEFHIARAFRDRFELRDLLFSYTGNVIFANVAASRRLAQQMNDARVAMGGPSASEDPGAVVHAGQLFAMGLIDELSHAVIERYRTEQDPALLTDALKWFGERVGAQELDKVLLAFTERFPNIAVYTGKLTAQEWLDGSSEGLQNREAALEELLLLWLSNQNPAYKPFRMLFDDATLRQQLPAYGELQKDADAYFETRPPFSPEAGTLLQALRAPFEAAPDSLSGQLDFIREHWAAVLGPAMQRTLLAIDTLREEEVAVWMQFNPAGRNVRQHGYMAPGGQEGFQGDEYVGYEEHWEDVVGADGRVTRQRRFRTQTGTQYAKDYQAPLQEYEAFSVDDAWMPTVVLMAKSTYVWLEQLSKKYGRHIHRLDQIPREELQLLRDRGMTGLWLIGLWERSKTSQTIKRLRGNPDAVASAYSLMDYSIADDIGGEAAFAKLRDEAAAVGLRLASDMVPNHMGLDSTWVIEHPEWFLRRSESPYPVYSFEGPDLSTDSRVEIKLEDHYYDMTDAAVVYRLRQRSGDGRTDFLYHGNDGTTFAWNDTAQLDYSQAQVREHVIQVILHVARRFPIIRFDAAMVLAKRHVQRLWFPLPGVGGSIPSRAEDAMTQEEFDRIMPVEFWREVVDRVQAEVPGTLLLAEAFWMLEGYFVRTLGMHRVYNSAFMMMLRDEENAKYRSYLKKTVEFDPDILKRYVNFMSNPDERTAIDQFGSGDKYFGVATMMATIPGLPMFAHGQLEGYTEKYGMDYMRAKMDEWPNDDLLRRHQHEIAPLLANRALFAESENFVFFDFWTENGTVDENVFAYSNRRGAERALILYNNAYGSTRGTVHNSAASMNKWTGELWQRSLVEALDLPRDDGFFLAYRDTATGLEYLRRASSLLHNGLSVDLRGYQYVVLLHWRELRASAEQPWDQLCDGLNGAGVHSLDEALTRLRLRPLTAALRHAIGRDAVQLLTSAGEAASSETVGNWGHRIVPVLERWAELSGTSIDQAHAYAATVAALAGQAIKAVGRARAAGALPPHTHAEALWAPLLAVAALRSLPAHGNVVDALQLRPSLAEIFSELGIGGEDAWRAAARVQLALDSADLTSESFWHSGDVQWLSAVNEHQGVRYINREALEQLLHWLALVADVKPAGSAVADVPTAKVLTAAETAGFRFDDMVKAILPEVHATDSKSVASTREEAENTSKQVTTSAAGKTLPSARSRPTKTAGTKTAAKKASAKQAAKAPAKQSGKKLDASPATVQPASVLETPPVDGHPVIDTAAVPDITASGQKAAAKKSTTKAAAKKSSTPKL
ncbi:MAG: alpha-amylase family glycosyl hydrolase [Janthinobacterium lividum]